MLIITIESNSMVFTMFCILLLQLYIWESKEKSVLVIKYAFIVDGNKLENK
jgi:hypothetical protein